MSHETTDVVIIGGGVNGSSTAYHLARAGKSVTVVDRWEPATEPAASWASAGGVRRQGRHQAEAALATEAIDRWRTLEEELGADVRYRREGNLRVAETDDEAETIRQFVETQHANGFTDVRLVDAKEAREIVPVVNDRVVAGSYSSEDGHADPAATTRAFAAAAQRHGATYLTNTTATELIVENNRVAGVRTSAGDILADATVVAAGAWSDALLAPLGIVLPVRMHALQMVLSTPTTPGLVKPVMGGISYRLSLKQLPSGEFLLGGGWPGQPSTDRLSYVRIDESVAGNWSHGARLIPLLNELDIARSWCGLEAISIDEIPYVGRYSGFDALFIAAGFSGHGFAIAPAVGRAVADQILGKDVPELSGLTPDRLDTMDAAAVQTYITADPVRFHLAG